jgi:hypothetical protein
MFDGYFTSMYRCYLLRDGRIVKAENLDVATLEEAIVAGRRLLAEQSRDRIFSGIEIWFGTAMLYAGSGGEGSGGTMIDGASIGGALGQPVTPAQR